MLELLGLGEPLLLVGRVVDQPVLPLAATSASPHAPAR